MLSIVIRMRNGGVWRRMGVRESVVEAYAYILIRLDDVYYIHIYIYIYEYL